jgi:hypothetical protein
MMRLVTQPDEWRIGPSLCGGLSMIHYPGFQVGSFATGIAQTL